MKRTAYQGMAYSIAQHLQEDLSHADLLACALLQATLLVDPAT